jgi:hypothetical protein
MRGEGSSGGEPKQPPASEPSSPEDEERQSPFVISRRDLLKYSGGMAAAYGATARLDLAKGVLAKPAGAILRAGAAASFSKTVHRRLDMLAITFEFFNLELRKAGQPGPGDQSKARLVRVGPRGSQAYVVIHFQPQSVGERAYFQVADPPDPNFDDGTEHPEQPPIPASLASPTRLAFLVPDDKGSIPFNLTTLLAWNTWTQRVVPLARPNIDPNNPPGFIEPLPTHTSIEAPWRLIMTPGENAKWTHANEPQVHGGRSELWHTRLGAKQNAQAPEPAISQGPVTPSMRAVWTPGFKLHPIPDSANLTPDPPGRTSLTKRRRYEIIRLTSDRTLQTDNNSKYIPKPVTVDRFMLSALGAWIDTHGDWPTVHEFGPWISKVIRWDHRAAMARDSFVRVVEKGYLFPFGHLSALITITERKFHRVGDAASGPLGAYLRQRAFIVVKNPVRDFPAGNFHPFGGRNIPFKTVEIVTRVTPNLRPYDVVNGTNIPKDPNNPGGAFFASDAFWPQVGTGDFQFHVRATDAFGQVSEFTAPLPFVSESIADNHDNIDAIMANYAGGAESRRKRPMSGQKVAFAKFNGGKAADTTHETQTMTFGGTHPDPENQVIGANAPSFFPEMVSSELRLSAAEQIKGGPLASAPTVVVDEHFRDQLSNPGQLFLRMADPADLSQVKALGLGFGADHSGGVMTPNMDITGFSAKIGPTGGDPATAAQGFNAKDFFETILAKGPKILGGIDLFRVVADVTGFGASDLEKIPKLIQQPFPDEIVVKLEWDPKPKSDNFLPFSPVFEVDPGGKTTKMFVKAEARTKISSGESSLNVEGGITDFHVNLLGKGDLQAITIKFNRLGFESKNGHKPDIVVDIQEVEYAGVLEFINKLREFLSAVGVAAKPKLGRDVHAAAGSSEGGGPDITVDLEGIRASYGIAIPDISVGVFTLTGIALSAKLNIPWIGDPARVRFAFAERESPFHITVCCFGGGGFVAVNLGLDGFESLEVSLEFGATLALDFGVASGSLSAFAGIYFQLEAADPSGVNITLTGYLRLNGSLNVLGLITASVEFYMEFTYEHTADGNSEVWGQAKITVSVSVLCFSADVTIGPVEKHFAGGGGGGGALPPPAADRVHAATADSNPIDFTGFFPTQGTWNEYADLYDAAAF